MPSRKPRFFVELPQDDHGGVACPPTAVFEGTVRWEPRFPLPDSPRFTVTGPEGHPACGSREWLTRGWRWAETRGPARELSRPEWEELTKDLEEFRG